MGRIVLNVVSAILLEVVKAQLRTWEKKASFVYPCKTEILAEVTAELVGANFRTYVGEREETDVNPCVYATRMNSCGLTIWE